MSILINTPCGVSLGIKEMNSLRTGSFARELGKREKKEEGMGRKRENEPAGMTFIQHLR